MNTDNAAAFERFVEGCWAFAKETAMRTKQDLPFTFIGHDAKGRHHLLVAHKYPDKRDFYRVVIFGYCQTYDIRMYAVVSSAWMRTISIPMGLSDSEVQKMKDNAVRPTESPDRIDALTVWARSKDFLCGESLQVFNTPNHYHLAPRVNGKDLKTIGREDRMFAETVRDSPLLNLTDFSGVAPVPAVRQVMSPHLIKQFFDVVAIASPELEKFFNPVNN